MAGGPFFLFACEKKKGRRRPTLARPSDALPSAMGPLTSVFGMGTGISAPLWPPAKSLVTGCKPGTKENYNSHETREILVQLPLHVVFEI